MRVVAATVTVSWPNSRMNRVGITAVAESIELVADLADLDVEVLGVELGQSRGRSRSWC